MSKILCEVATTAAVTLRYGRVGIDGKYEAKNTASNIKFHLQKEGISSFEIMGEDREGEYVRLFAFCNEERLRACIFKNTRIHFI